jgi:hypothetical protein
MRLAVMVARGAHAPDAYREVRKARWQTTLNDRQFDGLADFVTAWAACKPGRGVGARALAATGRMATARSRALRLAERILGRRGCGVVQSRFRLPPLSLMA